MKSKTLLHSVLDKEQRILTTPAADVAVSKLGSSSVDFMVMVWVQRADYFKVLFALNEAIKKRLKKIISKLLTHKQMFIFTDTTLLRAKKLTLIYSDFRET